VREAGHREHFRQLGEDGFSWSGQEPNTLFQNRGDGVFDEVGAVLGLDLRLDSRSVATADLDGDGDLDLVVTNRNSPAIKIYRNDSPVQGNVVQIVLTATTTHATAIGAQVTLTTADGRKQVKQITAGTGFMAQEPRTLTFGIGAQKVASVEVAWPRHVQLIGEVTANTRVFVREHAVERFTQPLKLRNYTRAAALPTGNLSVEAPDLTFAALGEGRPRRLAADANGTVVVNFWASWCVACHAEKADLVGIAESFRGKVTFLGVNMDEEGVTVGAELLASFGPDIQHVKGSVKDHGALAKIGQVTAGSIPMTVVIHKGIVRYVHTGAIQPAALREILANLTQ
jgi:thiol-disulfide isomerase/thioredoxin